MVVSVDSVRLSAYPHARRHHPQETKHCCFSGVGGRGAAGRGVTKTYAGVHFKFPMCKLKLDTRSATSCSSRALRTEGDHAPRAFEMSTEDLLCKCILRPHALYLLNILLHYMNKVSQIENMDVHNFKNHVSSYVLPALVKF
jgi:hypothetical protein